VIPPPEAVMLVVLPVLGKEMESGRHVVKSCPPTSNIVGYSEDVDCSQD
jgi:hypothetical protein